MNTLNIPRQFIAIFLLSAWALITPAHAEQSPSITVITPGHENNDGFWLATDKLMGVVANSLEIELDFKYSHGNPLVMSQLVDKIIIKKKKPDYVVLVGFRGVTLGLMRQLDEANIKTALFNGPLSKEQQQAFGTGKDFKHWVGSLLPNEQQGGYLLAQKLVEEARRKKLENSEGKIVVFGVSGANRSSASIARAAGLEQYANENDDVEIRDIKPADWKNDYANILAFQHLSNNKDTSVIWSASDAMAMGAIEAAKELAKKPGETLISGGIDWLKDAYPAIDTQALHGSVGGHFFDGAWILVALYDHFHGKLASGFAYETAFSFVDNKGLSAVAKATDLELLEKVDFKQWTQKNGHSSDYHFGADLILNKLKNE